MKIAVLASGGVDSSLALQLLRDQGHDVTAFYLKIWLEEELSFLGSCPWEEDLAYVEKLCKRIDVPLEVVSLQKEYWERVVSYTIASVRAGHTPNPDIFCNQRIKFGAFYDKINSSFEKVATGHYARISGNSGDMRLERTSDQIKDQTYFLSHLDQTQLSRALFPIGHLTKEEVRAFAQNYDLPSKDRKDSQGICFLGKIKFREFIRHHVGVNYGYIVEYQTGKKLGQHEGFWYHTIGQRRGLGLSGGPWYVVNKDTKKNIVYVSNKYYSVDNNRNYFSVSDCHWISGNAPTTKGLYVKIRHGAQLYKCTLDLKGNGGIVRIDENDQGIAPGQFAVFYDGEVCLGCGMIAKTA
jgi:tRNA-specific 2-thiouridylase